MTSRDRLADLGLQPFQERTARYVHQQMFENGQKRFLVADEVGLGKTKVAQGVLTLAVARSRNVLYLASSGQIVGQNLNKLGNDRLTPSGPGSLCLLADRAREIRGQIIGLTPIKDLRSDHLGSVHERALIYQLLRGSDAGLRRDETLADFFRGRRVRQSTFDYYAKYKVHYALRQQFLGHINSETLASLRDRDERGEHQRRIIGQLRGALATCTLEALNPAVVVVDEIQRFAAQLTAATPSPQVAYLLKRPMLVLSATPYQPNRVGGMDGPDPHKGFVQLVSFLNHGNSDRVEEVAASVAAVRSLLLADQIDRKGVEAAVVDLGARLRQFMVRTERPSDAHVERTHVAAELGRDDLRALRKAMDLLARGQATAKNQRRRSPELVELWKSAPYVVSALNKERYVIGRDIAAAVGPHGCPPATLTAGQLARERPLGTPAHPRLRALAKEMGPDAADARLWLPPTLPYLARDPGDAGPASKTLIFTSWAAAPPAIATAMNLMVEPKPGRQKDLEFSRKSKTGGASEPVRSVYLLGAPLHEFAMKSDPLAAVLKAGRPLAGAELRQEVRKQLEASGLFHVSQRAKRNGAVDLALAINQDHWPNRVPADRASYLRPARDLMRRVQPADDPVVSSTDANDMAELAAAAPGTCAFRALCRTVAGFSAENELEFSLAALSIGNSITRLFQRPGAVALVKAAGWNERGKVPYWRGVLGYCFDHDLQSVLDEYVYLLVSDSSEKDPVRLVHDVAETIEEALATVGTLQVARPKPKPGSASRRAMFARSLGEYDSSKDDPSATPSRRRRSRRRSSPLLTAFNSPFPPFVLASTSTGQEGLDMHRYCRRLVHWNLPTSPLALEQREGRVDRYLSLGVRTNIAGLGYSAVAREPSSENDCQNPWAQLVDAAKKQTDQHASPLAPLWHFGSTRPISAIALNIPLSREDAAWGRLLEEASWYRLVLGQPDPATLLARLSNASPENRLEIRGIRVDLSPPTEPGRSST